MSDAPSLELPDESKGAADEMGIAKTTASQHLRRAVQSILEFFIKYVNLSATDEGS